MTQSPHRLLWPGRDPDPVTVIPATSGADVLLVCEHAGVAVPAALDNLGLGAQELGLHIASDIGAETVARGLAQRLGCTLVVQHYSRLVIDCNRPPGAPDSIPEISDHVRVPGNTGLTPAARSARETEVFGPFAAACRREIDRPGIKIALSIHSFTPRMDGRSRPWDIGLLFRDPASRGAQMLALCRRMWPELVVGLNEPYSISDQGDWFIPVCAEPRALAHCLVEIRNDHLLDAKGCQLWADRLYRLITTFKETPPWT